MVAPRTHRPRRPRRVEAVGALNGAGNRLHFLAVGLEVVELHRELVKPLANRPVPLRGRLRVLERRSGVPALRCATPCGVRPSAARARDESRVRAPCACAAIVATRKSCHRERASKGSFTCLMRRPTAVESGVRRRRIFAGARKTKGRPATRAAGPPACPSPSHTSISLTSRPRVPSPPRRRRRAPTRRSPSRPSGATRRASGWRARRGRPSSPTSGRCTARPSRRRSRRA